MKNPFRKHWAIRVVYPNGNVVITKQTRFFRQSAAKKWASEMNNLNRKFSHYLIKYTPVEV